MAGGGTGGATSAGADAGASLLVEGNTYLGFTPPYAYMAEAASGVESAVRAGAGPK